MVDGSASRIPKGVFEWFTARQLGNYHTTDFSSKWPCQYKWIFKIAN
jgi:hypothetical protein